MGGTCHDPVDCSPHQWRIDPYQALVPRNPGRPEADRRRHPQDQPYAAVASFAEGLKQAPPDTRQAAVVGPHRNAEDIRSARHGRGRPARFHQVG